MSERVLVTGGRDYADADRISAFLEAIHSSRGVSLLIHGGSRGADALADAWARAHGVPVQSCPADWKAHGRSAGPIRNAAMFADHQPTLVVAFPGDRGTADIVKKARAAGVRVIGDGVEAPIACQHWQLTTHYPPRCRLCGEVVGFPSDDDE